MNHRVLRRPPYDVFPMAVERLLTDDSPQMEAVLEYLIYGKGGREHGVFEAKRLIEVIEALKAGTSFRLSSSSFHRTRL